MKTDYQTIQVEIRDNVAVFTMNNPPVNQLSTQFRSDLGEAFGEAYGDDAVKAIVLTGTGTNSIAGADIIEPDTYNRLFTLHGVIMIFLFIIPGIPAVFGNIALPLVLAALPKN